jgi:hypothetical protein
MTRTSQILALLASLVALAVTAPTASAAMKVKATEPAGARHWSLEPAGIRHGSVAPNPRVGAPAAYKIRSLDRNPFRIRAYKPQRRHFR